MGNTPSGQAAYFNKNKKKEVIDIRRQQIKVLPPSVAGLKCRDFLASDNDIGTIPEEIGKLECLQVLDMSNNRINNIPAEIGQVKTLRELYLANNKLFFTPITPAIGQLKALVKLDLSNNQLEELVPEIAGCVALEYLDVSNNLLKAFPIEFSKLENLQVLNINKNQLRVSLNGVQIAQRAYTLSNVDFTR